MKRLTVASKMEAQNNYEAGRKFQNAAFFYCYSKMFFLNFILQAIGQLIDARRRLFFLKV